MRTGMMHMQERKSTRYASHIVGNANDNIKIQRRPTYAAPFCSASLARWESYLCDPKNYSGENSTHGGATHAVEERID